MIDSVRRSARAIAGAPLVGRADISLLEHLTGCAMGAGSLLNLARSFLDNRLPAVIAARDTPGFGQPLGMSGGAFCASGDAIREAPMIGAYNEDILWMAYIRQRGFRLVRTSEPLVHADSRPLDVHASVVRQHAFGEALWLIVEQQRWGVPSGQALTRSWRGATRLLRDELAGIARRFERASRHRELRATDRRLLIQLTVALQREADAIGTLPVAVCRKALSGYEAEIAAWRTVWLACRRAAEN
jgi:hypothetical protein